jgi:hypothetical protein
MGDRRPNVAFFTVCGGGDDYDFLLGGIEHHAQIGSHLVLDTTPPPKAKTFRNLPSTVRWVYEPIYGHGWEEFRYKSALERAIQLANEFDPDVMVYLDSDEFFVLDDGVIDLALVYALQVKTITWKADGKAYDCGDSEWHTRVWPGRAEVRVCINTAWLNHPAYNGNPEHHPVVDTDAPLVRVEEHIHHHLHYAVGDKANELRNAIDTIPKFFEGAVEVPSVAWPAPLWRWKNEGVRPSSLYE